jgi:hypothetical protein
MSLPTSASLSTYGGILVDSVPVIDPASEISAASLNQLRYDAAAMTRTCPRAIFSFTTSATTPTLVLADAHWGNAAGVQPVIARTGTGVFTATLPASITDDLGNVVFVNARLCMSAMSGATLGFWNAVVTNSQTITIKTFTTASAASDLAGNLITVIVY